MAYDADKKKAIEQYCRDEMRRDNNPDNSILERLERELNRQKII